MYNSFDLNSIYFRETIQVLYKSLLSWALLACCVAGEGGERRSKVEG